MFHNVGPVSIYFSEFSIANTADVGWQPRPGRTLNLWQHKLLNHVHGSFRDGTEEGLRFPEADNADTSLHGKVVFSLGGHLKLIN